MNRAHWQRIESIFQGALDRPASVRSAYLDEACGGDSALRAEVLGLLAQHDTAPGFLDAPLVEVQRDLSPGPDGEHDVGHDVEHAAGHDVGRDVGRDAALTRIGPYRIVREIGAGGMGVVYLAMHEGPGFERPVALKVIRRGLDTDDVLRRFQLERRILAALKHPNVARLSDAGQTPDGRPFFVMDFVEGVPIDVYCEREALDIGQRLRLFSAVCDAVQHAHNNLIVHRDLKPGNILVGNDGAPVLLDFGIGKLIDPMESAGGASMTRTGARAFTPEFASPEQLRGEPVGTATDIYGLGLLLYRLLAGRRPFEPTTGYAYEKAVQESEPPRPSSFGIRALAGDLDTIVLKALRKEPERRYSSVAALSDDIQRHLDGLPVRARADTFTYRTGKFVRRHRLALAAAAVVFLSLIGATAYSITQARAVARERDKALEVQGFLLEMFGSTGPGRSDSVSVRQLLDGQAALVPVTYGSRPELRAQMLMVIGEGYDRLGLFAQAEPLLTDALEIRREVLPPNHPDIAASASMLGWVQFERGKSKEGEVLLREALALWPKTRPTNPAAYARSMNDLGVLREASGAYDEAIALHRRALAIRRRLFGDSNRAVAVSGSNLSLLLLRKGDFKGAVATAETALVVMRRVAGSDHQRSTLIQGNLATMRAQLGDVAGAEAEFRDLIARQIRVSGRQHPVTAFSQMAFASILRSQGKYAAAESILVESLASFEKAYGPEHGRVALALTALGAVRSSMGRYREARPMIERAVAIQRKLRGETHRDVGNALSALGAVHGDAGDWASAERVQRQALDAMERALGPKHLETASVRARLARAVLMRGKPAEAYSLYETAHDAMVAGGMQQTSATLRETRLRMVQGLIASGRYAEADSLLSVLGESLSMAQGSLRDSLRTALAARKGRE